MTFRAFDFNKRGNRKLTGRELNKFLFDNEIFDAYQYISNARKTIGIALFCKELILSLISKMEADHTAWQNDLFGQLFNQEDKIKSIALTASNMPTYDLEVCGIETSVPFLLDKLTKDFFQYIRNSFDCMSQAVNASCLASHAKNIERVDFGVMKSVFEQQTYDQMFPIITSWYEKIANSNEFSYIEAFNNRTKHICDVYLKLSMAIMGGENESTINPFLKKEMQHQRQTVSEYLTSIYDFASNAYSELLSELKVEILKKQLVENRFHKVKVYQQKFKSDTENGYSTVYIDATTDIANMPDEIEVLLVCEIDGEITAKNCPINTIYIKDPQTDHNYIGRYITTDICGDDTLLKYRKYQKYPYIEGTLPLCFQAMSEAENKGVFYHANPFMDITTISDDEDFLKRVQLPF